MATQQDNVLTHGMKGMIGNLIVFRTRGGKLIVAKKPKKRNADIPLTARQQEIQEQFLRCTRYAKAANNDATQREAYEAMAKPGQTALNVAFMDAFYPPEVNSIDLAEYTGQSGQSITIEATDKFRVANVEVEIRTAAGVVVEAGEAIEGTNGKDWFYISTTPNAALLGSTITATAYDVPGNKTVLSQQKS